MNDILPVKCFGIESEAEALLNKKVLYATEANRDVLNSIDLRLNLMHVAITCRSDVAFLDALSDIQNLISEITPQIAPNANSMAFPKESTTTLEDFLEKK
jgi:hypothetical protein